MDQRFPDVGHPRRAAHACPSHEPQGRQASRSLDDIIKIGLQIILSMAFPKMARRSRKTTYRRDEASGKEVSTSCTRDENWQASERTWDYLFSNTTLFLDSHILHKRHTTWRIRVWDCFISIT
ncbi:unnamed protein product [Linum trigynum]|uniref:Uncharacterized protein n=1 Tax=Linum trigynum TaxID=586398 RepID=A0AAV2FNG2_9ROSI